MLEMIVAHDNNRCIGKDNKLAWNIREDMQFFRKMTTGKTVVMGRKTYESIGRLLPKRVNIILSTNKDFEVEGAKVVSSMDEVLELKEDIVIIGGGVIYEMFLPYVSRLYVTKVDKDIKGDTFFPVYEDQFECVMSDGPRYSEQEGCNYSFNLYIRN